jgi:hypothetical protein
MMDWALPHPRWAIHPECFVRIAAGHPKGHKRPLLQADFFDAWVQWSAAMGLSHPLVL